MEKYTEIEKKLIERAFEKTRLEFKKDPSIENDEDIVLALRRYKNSYHMGPEKQEIAAGIFQKNGLWKNGKTTLEEYNKKVLDEKLEQTIRLNHARDKFLGRLKEMQETINAKIVEMEQKPREIARNLLEKRNEIQAEARERLDAVGQKLEEQLHETASRLQEEYERAKNQVFIDLKKKIDDLKMLERAEVDKVLVEFDELSKLKEQYMGLEREHARQVEPLEKQLEKTDSQLFDLTVRELKELADNKGLEYPSKIVKADLVNLIENNDEVIFEE